MSAEHDGQVPPAATLTRRELDAVRRAMRAAGADVGDSMRADLVAGGRSNLTFALDDGMSRWVLRTPPRHGRTPSAHDVAREHRVTAALHAVGFPVAAPLLLVEDEEVIGVPFTVVQHVDGNVIRTADELLRLRPHVIEGVVDVLVEQLAALHEIDHRAAGLADFGRPTGYAARQLRRWSGQWKLVGDPANDAAATELSARLSAELPRETRVGVVHGDYRIDNVLLELRGEPQIAAVLDWELATIGASVADVATMCAYRLPAFDLVLGAPSAWTSALLPAPQRLAARYEHVSGRALEGWAFHLGLAYLKIAVIAAGIDHRRRSGGASGAGFDTARDAVGPFLHAGLEASADWS